jgi:hypothetical protein
MIDGELETCWVTLRQPNLQLLAPMIIPEFVLGARRAPNTGFSSV